MKRLPAITFWRLVAAVILAAGLYATFVRFAYGLGASTNLSDGYPWGLWIGFDVLVGVGLAAGGFTLTAAVHIFNLERFHTIVRPTILTAFLGYLLVIVGLLFDLGLPWRVWHPIIMWNPHSVMFEVGWCVTLYTTVLALEFSPMVLERLRWHRPLRLIRAVTVPVVICGVLLSTLHQSSLGTLFIIVPNKLYGLWYSPLLPLLFFVSAIAGGLGMVILESAASARAFGRRLEQDLLQSLGRVIVVVLALYLAIKLQDMAAHSTFHLLLQPGIERFLFAVEFGFGAVVPMVLLAIPAVRREAEGLVSAALLVVLGFVLGRMNVALTGTQRLMGSSYFPSWMEIAVTALLVVAGFIAFTLAVRYLNVFPEEHHHASPAMPVDPPCRAARYAARGALVALGLTLLLGALTLGGDRQTAAPAAPVPPREALPEASLPVDLTWPAGPNSPGAVVFSHGTHASVSPPNCVQCHPSRFSLLGQGKPRAGGEAMHGAERCGACHNGTDAFSGDDCQSCHAP